MNLRKKSPRASFWRNAAAAVTVLLFTLQGLTPQIAAARSAGNAQTPPPAAGESARQYSAQAAGAGGFRSGNPAHGWNIAYGAGGATQLAPRAGTGDWQWSLALAGYGYGDLVNLSAPPTVRAYGQRVIYRWDDNISEWWNNSAAGLEQGFTVRKQPAGATAGTPLHLQMRVDGDLLPVRQGEGILFLDQAGVGAFTYDKLHAWDAAGRVLPAQLALAGGTLSILVDDTAATYPVTIDPILQQAYLKANNVGPNDQYGYSVAIAGNTIAVGAPAEDSSATTVNGNGGDNSAADAGAVYVYTSSNNQWSLQAYIKAANAQAGDQFGYAVALAGDTLVVGAPGEDSSGGPTDNSASGAGAAYVFVRSGTTWSQAAYLKASNIGAGDGFGTSVAIDTGIIAVGAPYEDGAGGNQADNSAADAGAAYVYQGSGSQWMQSGYLKASNTGAGDRFGWTVGALQQTVVVGAPYEDSIVTGVNPFSFDNSATDAGAAYIFANAGAWIQQAYVKATNTGAGDLFGWSVAVASTQDGFSIAIGAPGEDSRATGVNGNPFDDTAANAGAVYTYLRSGVAWSSNGYLKAVNSDPGDQFGWSVAANSNWLVVGAPNEDGGGMGTAAPPYLNNAPDAGAAYIFGRFVDDHNVVGWYAQDYEKASNTDPGDQFGRAVAVVGEWTEPAGIRMVVGAPYEDSGNPGGGGFDNMASDAGASYAFGWFLLYVYPTGTGTGSFTEDPWGFLQGTDMPVLLAASPNGDSTFDGWSGDCSGTANCPLVMNSSKIVYATFNLKQYTVGLSAVPPEGGSVTGGGTVTHGSTVTATATANPGYAFVEWSEGGTPVAASAEYTFTATGDRALTATFATASYNVGAVTGGAGGSVSIEPPTGPYLYGTVVTATATADPGYTFVEWSDGGVPVSPGAVYTFTVTSDHALSAAFAPLGYNVSTTATGSGSGAISFDPPGGVYSYGTVITATATAATGSTFSGWSGDCNGIGDCVLTVDNNKNITAAFTALQYNIGAVTGGAGGSVGIEPPTGPYIYGMVITATATADSGYAFVGWSEGGAPVSTSAVYTFTVTGDSALSAAFAPLGYSVSTATDGSGSGSVSLYPPGGTYSYGTVVTATATANVGSILSGWSGDCSGSGTCVLTVDSDKSVTATFATAGYNIGAVGGGAGGSVSVEPPTGPYLYGAIITVTATADPGYAFAGWSEGGTPVSTSATYTFTVTGDHTLSAGFTPLSYNVGTATAGAGSGSVSLNPPGGVYTYGTVVTATATAGANATFTAWSGDCSGSGACVLTVDGDKTVTATFATAVDAQPHVEIAATAGVTQAIVGETIITYTYQVTNTGAVPVAASVRDSRLGAVALAVPPGGMPQPAIALLPGQAAAGKSTYVPQLSDLPGPLAGAAVFTATTPAGSSVLTQTSTVNLLVRAQGHTIYTGDGIGLGSPYGGGFDLVVFEGDAPVDLFLSGVSSVSPYTGDDSLDNMTDLLLGQGCPGTTPCNTISQIIFDSNGRFTTGTIVGGQGGGDLYLPLIHR